MFQSRPLLTRFVAFVVVPCLLAGYFVRRHLHASLPETSGSLTVAGLSAPVEIRRDRHGIPTIDAKNDRDAFFAAGYVHAQDRLWQLELQRRIVDGRLAEVFGKGSISDDVWLRTLGLRRAAEASWQTLTPEAKESLAAYTAGINAWLATHDDLPPEFAILGITPKPWSVYDSLGWNNMFALTLGGNFREEITRFVASQSLPPRMLAAMFEGYPADAPVTVAAGEETQTRKLAAMGESQQHLERNLGLGGRYVGSNAWAVSGAKSVTGQALLANDPHLPLQLPSLWYGIRINGDRLHVAGMSLVGLPLVIFGRNPHVAWGGTNMMADQQDLYFERVNPADPSQYEVNGRWEKFATRTETIAVKNDFPAFLRSPLRPITIEVRSTRHGPVISDQFDLFEQPVALRWSLLENRGSSYESLYRAGYASDWASFNAAFRDYVAPALNLLYSDDRGNIGYAGVGRIPLRARGEGTLPVPGWNDDYEWRGSIPYDEMPRSFNPAKGYIVNANNRITADDYPYFISHDWAPRTRASRIEQLLVAKLAAKQKLSLTDMRDVQADVAMHDSLPLVKILAAVRGKNAAQQDAIARLATWDGSMDRDSVPATLFYAWTDHLRSYIFLDEIEGPWNRRGRSRELQPLVDRISDDELASILTNDPQHWCDLRQTPAVETCQQAMTLSLQRTLKTLHKTGGSNVDHWTWGAIHKAHFEHTPFSGTTLLRRVFEREIGSGGAPNSVNVAGADLDEAKGYVQRFGAGFRQLMSLGPRGDQHLYMNSTGQSGNVVSTHYDDMLEPFRDVTYYSIAPASAPAAAFTLRPAAPPGS